jgi:hypothetical protein
MRELTLDRVSRGRYALGEIGTLRALPRFAAEIEADGTSWTLRRAAAGFGQTIHARENGTREPVSSYVPSGFLHLRGIYAGKLTRGERVLEWRANHQLGRQFTLTEGGSALARFAAGSDTQPVAASVEDLGRLEPLLLLFCCHIVKQAVDTAKVAAVVGTEAAIGG